jgi:hypothetical protein
MVSYNALQISGLDLLRNTFDAGFMEGLSDGELREPIFEGDDAWVRFYFAVVVCLALAATFVPAKYSRVLAVLGGVMLLAIACYLDAWVVGEFGGSPRGGSGFWIGLLGFVGAGIPRCRTRHRSFSDARAGCGRETA